MPTRDWKFRIEDIITSIREIMDLTQGMDFAAFSADKKTVKAVLFNLAIIGEASRRVPKEITEKYPLIPWRVMGDLRNVVIHEYFGVDLKIIWETIHHDLPVVLPLLKEVLSKE
jgi:uncharacterized protein with HEPN domain